MVDVLRENRQSIDDLFSDESFEVRAALMFEVWQCWESGWLLCTAQHLGLSHTHWCQLLVWLICVMLPLGVNVTDVLALCASADSELRAVSPSCNVVDLFVSYPLTERFTTALPS